MSLYAGDHDIRNVILERDQLRQQLATQTERAEKLESRLLNAFQLVKNGIKIGYLKFDEFEILMDKKHDHTGQALTQEGEG